MATSDGSSQVLDAVAASVCPDPDVEFVVAFGSQVAGESTGSSDLDLAVKFADELSNTERFEKRCFLSGDLQREDAPFVDLSDIETLPLDVAHDAVNGTFVCGDEHAFEQFKADIDATFADQRDDLRRHRRDVIDRIAEDGLRG
ncbi:nucleotidyltransferase domain-containing protein [Haloarcula sp. JP-L23]|uniref:nucleotidyltransferase domain-containing protein n=1 Tax=Haloarcula sp. JP-L23 TaxID=2716717 RepID=UPI00140E9A8F|nr:nucleotidyltransferase domain-containing protein [Haloarcula sp. JP-L23]